MRFTSKKDYFVKLNEKNITDNKTFWKTVKPFLSKKKTKKQYSERINHTEENDSLLKNCEEVAKELNSFFANGCKESQYPKLRKL